MTDRSMHGTDLPGRLGWYEQARFGMFIHWGAYSVAGVEASWPMMAPDLSEVMFGTIKRITEEEYVSLPGRFNPVDFNAAEWVRLAQQAGMRYMIITSKHHDGFCMFDAPGTDYKITNTPFGRDICLELAQACEKAGMPLGFYYSPPDMHHPGYRDTNKPVVSNWTGEPKRKEWEEYLDTMESHIRKLLSDYGKVSILWFDGLTNFSKYDPARFHKLVHELSPDTLINDRLGEGYDYITPEQFIPKKGIPTRSGKLLAGSDPGGDGFFRMVMTLFKIPGIRNWLRKQMQKYNRGELVLTPVYQESHPSPERFQPWETCMTMGGTWAHNPDETGWKSPQTLLRNLVNVVSRGGNYLLNVGPTAQGTFPAEALERLEHIGRWMDTHAEAIHGSTYTPLQGQPWGQATRNGDRLFLHVFDQPAAGNLVVAPFPGEAKNAWLLNGTPLEFRQAGQRLEISLPVQVLGQELPVVQVGIDSREPGWQTYSQPVPGSLIRRKYMRSQAVASFVINAVLNGLIAFSTYRARVDTLSYPEAAIDILISVAIITFLTGWWVVGGARKEAIKGNLPRFEKRRLMLPRHASLWGLVIMLAATLLFGGVFMDGLLYLLSPAGVSPQAYILIKTIYTGASGAIASLLAIWSVLAEKEKR